jgi:sec-independent protein translocase protein TatC
MTSAPASSAAPQPDPVDEKRMPFLAHLAELRVCLRRAAIGYLIGVIVAGVFAEELFVILIKPLADACVKANITADINFASPIEPFWVYFKVAMIFGLFLSAPILFWQLWRFVGPGLYRREKKLVLPFTIFSVLFFVGGAAFCQLVVLPLAYPFFLGYSKAQLGAWTSLFGHRLHFGFATPINIKPVLMMESVMGFSIKMLLAFGLVFELPLALAFLASVGIVSARALWRFNKYAVIICFTVGAVLTPGPDVLSQCLMSIPLWLLYNMSIVIAWMVGRSRRKAAAAAAAGEGLATRGS